MKSFVHLTVSTDWHVEQQGQTADTASIQDHKDTRHTG